MLPEITVVNITRYEHPDAEYIGRRTRGHLSASPLGNPFRVGRDGSRMDVIQKYRVWLEKNRERPRVKTELQQLADLAREQGHLELGCWCAPLACHGDVVRDVLLEILKTPSDTAQTNI